MTSVMYDKLPKLQAEYGLNPYNGPRTGCAYLWGMTSSCSRLRHKHDHAWDGEHKLTIWNIIDNLKETP